MRTSFSKRRLTLVVGVVLLVVGVPVALAASGTFGSSLDRQSAKWTTTNASTSSTDWKNVPGLSLSRCTVNQVTATLSATVSGAPARFRVVVDAVEEAPMKPGAAAFVPDGQESFSYTFVGRTGQFEDDDTHSFAVQWRSPTGGAVNLQNGALNLLYQQGTRSC